MKKLIALLIVASFTFNSQAQTLDQLLNQADKLLNGKKPAVHDRGQTCRTAKKEPVKYLDINALFL